MRHVGAIEDEVEGEGVILSPIFLIAVDKLLRAELLGIFLFTRRVRDYVYFGSHSRSPENSEMAETAPDMDSITDMVEVGVKTYIPTMAIFLPGPVPARKRGL